MKRIIINSTHPIVEMGIGQRKKLYMVGLALPHCFDTQRVGGSTGFETIEDVPLIPMQM